MEIKNEYILTGEMLFADVKSHMAWLADIAGMIAFSEGHTLPPPPGDMIEYIQEHPMRRALDKEFISLNTCHQSLHKQIETMNVAGGATPAHFDGLKRLLDMYVSQLKRIERLNQADALAVYAPDIRMKGGSLLHDDILGELNRGDRKNAPFCVINLAIDADTPAEKSSRMLADLIKSVLRSFDDAYYIGGGEFVLSLKDIDSLDAARVMERLRKMAANIDPASPFTVSCGIIEPVPGDSPGDILKAAQSARLKAQEAGGDMVEEYSEKSTLAKLAQGPASDL